MIEKPDCLAYAPIYSFWKQSQAVFLRKYYFTIRSLSSYISIIIPLALMICGCFIIQLIDEFAGVYYL
jgi:hypothetical protein